MKVARLPRCLRPFFYPARRTLSRPQFQHLWRVVLALAVGLGRRHVLGIAGEILGGRHRTKVGDFLFRAPADFAALLKETALRTLRRWKRRRGERPLVLLDGTHVRRRGKGVQGADVYYDPVNGGFVRGHHFLWLVLRLGARTVPWAVDLHLKPPHAKSLGRPFRTLTQIAADLLRGCLEQAGSRLKDALVVADSAFFTTEVLKAVRDHGLHMLSTLRRERVFHYRGSKHKVGRFGRCIPSGQYRRLVFRAYDRPHRVWWTSRIVWIPGWGQVRIVFCRHRRRVAKQTLALVSTDLSLTPQQIVRIYTERWAIEMWVKDAKQHLGLGDCRTATAAGTLRHGALVGLAYCLLGHFAEWANSQRQGRKVPRPRTPTTARTIEMLRAHLWDQELRRRPRSRAARALWRRIALYAYAPAA